MTSIFIVGAGPTGMAAALFLAKHGIKAHIVDKKKAIDPHSKALGVNPRSLSLLKSTGVTDQMLSMGWKVSKMNFWRDGKRVFQTDMSGAKTPYPFMLVLPQSKSEMLLAEALEKEGISIHLGDDIQLLDNIESDLILGADGAHSFVREAMHIPMHGDAFPESWQVIDLPLEVPFDKNQGHVIFYPDGGLFMLRVEDNIWRLVTNMENPLELLPKGATHGDVNWQSTFHIVHRIAETMQKGKVCLAGDAAHLHSPMGGRGMNLGIEDAYVFANLVATGKIDQYNAQRYPVDKRVVDKVRMLTELPRGRLPQAKLARRMLPLIGPLMAFHMRKWVLGLDHNL